MKEIKIDAPDAAMSRVFVMDDDDDMPHAFAVVWSGRLPDNPTVHQVMEAIRSGWFGGCLVGFNHCEDELKVGLRNGLTDAALLAILQERALCRH